MQNRLTVPSVGTVFNNYLLPIKQFTANQWEKINEHQILSGRYSEVRAVVRSQKDAKVIKVLIVSRDECFKQLEKIKKTQGME